VVADRTKHVALVQLNQRPRGNLGFMPFQRRGEDRAGHNKMPAQGALANGLKLPRCRDVV
jgi:hypothetical protein